MKTQSGQVTVLQSTDIISFDPEKKTVSVYRQGVGHLSFGDDTRFLMTEVSSDEGFVNLVLLICELTGLKHIRTGFANHSIIGFVLM